MVVVHFLFEATFYNRNPLISTPMNQVPPHVFFTFFPCSSPYEGDFTRENKSWDGKFHTESGALKHALNGQAVRENSHRNGMPSYLRT